MRTIRKIHHALAVPMEGLMTHSPLSSPGSSPIDPFIFLNHHGPQVYRPNNQGLPFGPHPHRGMETVTFILDGDIRHKDSTGYDSVITSGGVQWMTAGSGLIHAETSSDEFRKTGGKLEILQLWLNLPARLKMTEPFYKGLHKEDIPTVAEDGGRVKLNLIAGEWKGTKGPVDSLTDTFMSTIEMEYGGKLTAQVPADRNIFLYVVRGNVKCGDKQLKTMELAEFANDGDTIELEAVSDSFILFGHARPFNEPVAAYGPFVMNTMEEIHQAFDDYQQGKFGVWRH